MVVQYLNAFPWWAYSLLANLAIAFVEYTNRTARFDHFGEQIVVMWPLILASQFALFYTWRDGPSFMYAWAFFTTGNIVCRVVSSHYFVGERLTMTVGFGVALIILGGYFVRQGIVK